MIPPPRRAYSDREIGGASCQFLCAIPHFFFGASAGLTNVMPPGALT